MSFGTDVRPTCAEIRTILESANKGTKQATLVPLCVTIPADLLTPSLAYLKIRAKAKSKLSFLFESAATTETIGRYSFVGTDPRKVLKSGPGHGEAVDPLFGLQTELDKTPVLAVPGLSLPPLTGGAIGYVSYDCVRYFEPKTARNMKDILELPESFFMLCDTIVAFDHFFQVVKIISYLEIPSSLTELELRYEAAKKTLLEILATLQDPAVPLPPQGPITPNQEYISNIGQEGYEAHVKKLKEHIVAGNIIQAVPSQRVAHKTSLHPFNIYRHLRTVNPSPYLFYIDCDEFQLVGASPELLVKKDVSGRIVTHPIAGTIKRGATPEEDELLAEALRASLKDRAEHVMLVDLARNDVNRVCDPLTTKVDRLMVVERFSHVQHLVSEVSGTLREGMTRFDAFRSIFPAGTVSGAPKVRAMELIAELEGEKRGVYAGAVGYFGYPTVSAEGAREEGDMDTCIALRTMVTKGGYVYLQAGGGIVFDSDPTEEYEETINKMKANRICVEMAEKRFVSEVSNGPVKSG